MVRVLYFAGARDRTGVSSEELPLGGHTITSALQVLVARHARLHDVVPLCRFAVDQGFVPADTVLKDGSELALIPPVAGG